MPVKKREKRGTPARPRPAPLRVSVVKYLNTAPLIHGLQKQGLQEQARGPRFHLSFTVPSACADDLRAGAADVGIIPSIAYQTIPGLLVVPRVAIASERKVESVLLVSRGPARRAKRVALDTSSRTSAALVKILFALHWKTEPRFVESAPDLPQMLEVADAALVIGDPALRVALRGPRAALPSAPNLHVYDLAAEWWRLTQLPFVFAVWAVRAEKVRRPEDRRRLARAFADARDSGLQHLDEIAREASARLQLPGGQLARYLRHSIDYRLDAPRVSGLESFYRYARDLGLIEKVRPLEFL